MIFFFGGCSGDAAAAAADAASPSPTLSCLTLGPAPSELVASERR